MTDSESDRTSSIQPSSVEVALADVHSLSSYIKHIYIGADIELLQEALSQKSGVECVQNLIADPQVKLLIVDRINNRDATNPDDTTDEFATIRVSNEMAKRSERTTSLVLVKTGTVIEADKSIEDQLYVLRLPEGNPYDVLLTLFGRVGAPFFKTLKDSGNGERDGDKLAASVEKSLNEVEVSLLHMQQNIDIPEINLVFNPVIKAVVEKAASEGRKAKVEELGENIENSVFLNTLQKGVNRWIKEIQKVLLHFV
uniref:Dynein light chain n=1 Tax=Syphacia muris TaxID=451379 RepID=A0A0N5ACB7_9BILA